MFDKSRRESYQWSWRYGDVIAEVKLNGEWPSHVWRQFRWCYQSRTRGESGKSVQVVKKRRVAAKKGTGAEKLDKFVAIMQSRCDCGTRKRMASCKLWLQFQTWGVDRGCRFHSVKWSATRLAERHLLSSNLNKVFKFSSHPTL